MCCFALTGGVGSGKSTVARMFEELGAKVIDADQIGHELLRPSLPTYHEVVQHFGQEILDPSGKINRQRLGAIVFGDAKHLRELNAILHPRIIERVEELVRSYRAEDHEAVVLVDAALIYEAGIADRFQGILVVWCRPQQQIERLMAKTGLSRELAAQRVAAQIPAEEKRRRADFLIDSTGDLTSTRAQVEVIFSKLKHLAAG